MDKQTFISVLTDIYFELLCYDENATGWKRGFIMGESKAINRIMKQIYTKEECAEIRKAARQEAREEWDNL